MNDKKIGELRASQLITTFGPGAIMDLPDFSVIIAGLDDWNIKLCTPIEEPRLTNKLKLKKIYSPPLPVDTGNGQSGGAGTLPAYRFPKYMVCPNCRRLKSAGKFHLEEESGIAYCFCDHEEKTRVFPSRFIVACPHGHVDDFPWNSFVHAEKRDFECKGDLELLDEGATGSIADVIVRCKECKTERSMQDAFDENKLKALGKCRGRRPWLGWDSEEECGQSLRAMLRGASNIYFPIVASALRIPPYTSPVHLAVADHLELMDKVESFDDLKGFLKFAKVPDLEVFEAEQIWETLLNQRNLVDVGPSQDLYFPEYEKLLGGPGENDPYEFEVENAEVPTSFSNWISDLVLVRRLTEVRVLYSFTRIDSPPDITSMMSGDVETKEMSEQASLSKKYLTWRPGIITRGEGIFLTLNEQMIQDWEEQEAVREAGDAMELAYGNFCEDRNIPVEQRVFPGARYVLLHSLSHALMRQLCLDSGYSSTALRERIYSRSPEEGDPMAGILIYTATPDSEGSLGGLVELGQTQNFAKVLQAALHESAFCSGDPLCSEHSPGTVGDINGAACHACQLSAETSCESSNRFLDRNFLVPTISNTGTAFFNAD